jgi:hypothetical protein
MIGAALALLVLANDGGTPAPPPARHYLVKTLSGAGLKPELLAFATERLSFQLGALGVRTVTESDIETLKSVQHQKQMMGCTTCDARPPDFDGEISAKLSAAAAGGIDLELKATGPVPASARAHYEKEADLMDAIDRAVKELAVALAAPAKGQKLAR